MVSGTLMATFEAMRRSQVDCCVDYSGNVWAILMGRPEPASRAETLRGITDYLRDRHGIQCLGTNSLTIRHNTITMPVGSTSCVILSTGSADVMQNVLIDNNKMAGGVYSVYAGYQAGSDDISKVANISVTNNKFSTQFFANGGSSGAITSRDSPVVVTGNVWYDGPNAGTPVN